jgi:hypothetical protein
MPVDGEATYKCGTTCDGDMYLTSTPNLCEFCPSFCTACDSATECTACDATYKIHLGLCVDNCPATYYFDGELNCNSCGD